MATTFGLKTPEAQTTAVAGTVFNALANNTCKAGAVITPAANPPALATYQLKSKFVAGSIAVGATLLKCWFCADPGGSTNYDDSNSLTSTTAPGRAPDFIFLAGKALNNAVGYSQSVPLVVARPAFPFTILTQNTSGFACTTSDTDTVLYETTDYEYGA